MLWGFTKIARIIAEALREFFDVGGSFRLRITQDFGGPC